MKPRVPRYWPIAVIVALLLATGWYLVVRLMNEVLGAGIGTVLVMALEAIAMISAIAAIRRMRKRRG